MRYPIDNIDRWYGECDFAVRGAVLRDVPAQDYIASVRPLSIDEISRENIDDLKNHIQQGRALDPLLIRQDGKEDGRHRAHACLELGIESVPVICFGEHFKDCPEWEMEIASPTLRAKERKC